MKKLLFVLGIILLLIIGALTYTGFMPGLSQLIVKQKELGVKADPSVVATLKSRYGKANALGRVSVNEELSGDDVSGVFAFWEQNDPIFPLHAVQIRFNQDGTGEASGYLKIDAALSLATRLGYSAAEINKGKEYIKYISGDLPFYVKGTGDMKNNSLSLKPNTFQIGNITVPSEITNPAAIVVEDMIKRRLQQIGGVDIKDANFSQGKLHLEGEIPHSIQYK